MAGTLQRIKQFIEFKGITVSAFEKNVGFSNGSFASQLKNNKTIGLDKLENILNFYPDIDINWLLTGAGLMLKNTATPPIKEPKNTPIPPPVITPKTAPTLPKTAPATGTPALAPNEGIPLIPVDAFAGIGFNNNHSIALHTIEERYVIPLFEGKGIDFLITVSGSSMWPKYASGDVVACKIVHERLFIQWNKIYVVNTHSQGVLIKRLKKSTNDNAITCRSDNKDYDDFDIPLDDIENIALVVGCIRLE